MAKKKSFVTGAALYEDPALSFITRGEEGEAPAAAGPERKSRRVQLILPPSLYSRVKGASQRAGLSLNEFCRQALERSLKE